MKYFNNMQAFLSEEFRINIFVETNIFLISTGQCFSLKYLSRFSPNSEYYTDTTSEILWLSLGFLNFPKAKAPVSIPFSGTERPMENCNCLTSTGVSQQRLKHKHLSLGSPNPYTLQLRSRREHETFPRCPHLALLMGTGEKLHVVGIMLWNPWPFLGNWTYVAQAEGGQLVWASCILISLPEHS